MAERDRRRDDLMSVFRAALAAVSGRPAVRSHLEQHPLTGPVHVVAIGKAAASMAAGAADVLGEDLAAGLVLTKTGHCQESGKIAERVTCMESSHPVPDASSLQAGAALLEFLDRAPADARFLFLISGGASSLVERLPEDIGADELARVNRWLLGSGISIHGMNRVRKALSAIKGGRLATHLAGRPTLNLLISDVPGDDLGSIGSGLLIPHTPGDLSLVGLELPGWLSALVAGSPPLPERSAFDKVHSHIVASPAHAWLAAARKGEEAGYAVRRHDALVEGDALEAGRQLAGEVVEGPPALSIWGGETTVRLPPEPGRGGRCQSLALAAAEVLQGREGVWFLAAGTDGTDGPSDDAGALVDGGTVSRGALVGLSADRSLDEADAGRFLEASGDLIHTGPTGTNVMDLMLGLKV